MGAAAFAYKHGVGVAASAASAARWYRAAIGARGQHERARDEDEAEGERLPGGDLSEADLLSALAALHQVGGADLQPDSRLSRQFEMLAGSTRRRDLKRGDGSDSSESEAEGEGKGEGEGEGGRALDSCGEVV